MSLEEMKDSVLYAVRAALLRRNYARALKRIRKARGVRRIRVAFLVSELAKWKAQPVFDLMRREPDLFEPFVALMELTRNAKLPVDELHRMAEEKARYFRERDMPVVDIWRYGTDDTVSIGELDADIVFYQQPWDLPERMKPLPVSRRALTFYFPYSTPNRWLPKLDLGHKLHHFLFGYIVINEELAELYRKMEKTDFVGAYVPVLLPFGHPTLDGIEFDDRADDGSRCVIYAPHWSVQFGGLNPPLKYATFLENGQDILAFAKAHPEVKWAFKPHPDLRSTLVRTGAMTQADVDAYYREWESIGESCYAAEGEYRKLFARSRALITDCGSFLTEYGCTGKPVIRLICRNLNVEPHPSVKALYAKYYNVRNRDEMREAFERVVLRHEDPMREERVRELRRANLVGHDVAGRIVGYIRDLIVSRSPT